MTTNNPLQNFFEDLFGGISEGLQSVFDMLGGKSSRGSRRRSPAGSHSVSATLQGGMQTGALRALLADTPVKAHKAPAITSSAASTPRVTPRPTRRPPKKKPPTQAPKAQCFGFE